MFNLFQRFIKRSSVYNWEKTLLINIFNLLGDNYVDYVNQITDGVLRKVSIGSTVLPNYIGFLYDTKIVGRYDQKSGLTYTLRGINVFDKKCNQYINIEIHISHGLIMGYSTPTHSEFELDVSKVKLDGFKKDYWYNNEYLTIKSILSPDELSLINPNDVYEVQLEGRIYYHLQDIEDGDFIGIDKEKNVYKFVHSPFEIIKLTDSIEKVLLFQK